jgi:hypothetical protein
LWQSASAAVGDGQEPPSISSHHQVA